MQLNDKSVFDERGGFFNALPLDTLCEICKFVDVKTMVNLFSHSKRFLTTSAIELWWRSVCRCRFPARYVSFLSESTPYENIPQQALDHLDRDPIRTTLWQLHTRMYFLRYHRFFTTPSIADCDQELYIRAMFHCCTDDYSLERYKTLLDNVIRPIITVHAPIFKITSKFMQSKVCGIFHLQFRPCSCVRFLFLAEPSYFHYDTFIMNFPDQSCEQWHDITRKDDGCDPMCDAHEVIFDMFGYQSLTLITEDLYTMNSFLEMGFSDDHIFRVILFLFDKKKARLGKFFGLLDKDTRTVMLVKFCQSIQHRHIYLHLMDISRHMCRLTI